MKVLVLGQGGREHAIVHALSRSPSVREIHVAPGNDGMSRQAVCHAVSWKDTDKILQLCLKNEIDFVIIGPEDPLVDGLADRLRERGVLVVGPSGHGARLEGSKIYCKNFMAEAGIPTARYKVVHTVSATMEAARSFTPPYVLKADGLAAGKGVLICHTLEQLRSGAADFFEKQTLGPAGTSALLEQFTPGWELSYLVLTNGQDFQALPIAQDHKRLSDHDEGPNTGGMGTVAPLKISPELQKQIDEKIMIPCLRNLQKHGIVYRGVLFMGLMITDAGPSLLEINCRFGDPETQVLLPLIENDFGQVMKSLATGQLVPLKFRPMSAACVVMAAPGYPSDPKKGVLIHGNVFDETPSSYFIVAGAKKESSSSWVTNGGRVLCAIGLGGSLKEAIDNAYVQKAKADWAGVLVRSDIGKKQITSPNEH